MKRLTQTEATRLYLAGWAVLAVGLLGLYIAYLGSKTAIALPLGTAVAAMILGHRWSLRTEVVATCLFLAVLGALFCQEPTFFFNW